MSDTTTPEDFRIFAVDRFNATHKVLVDLLSTWEQLDLPSTALADDEYPFDQSLDEVVSRIAACVERIENRNDRRPEMAGFLEQNTATAKRLVDHPELIDQVEAYAEHHSGGLLVLGKRVAGGCYLKLHDTWGPEEIEGAQTIVLHHYDPDGMPDDSADFGPAEWVAHFESGVQAVRAFLAIPEVAE